MLGNLHLSFQQMKLSTTWGPRMFGDEEYFALPDFIQILSLLYTCKI